MLGRPFALAAWRQHADAQLSGYVYTSESRLLAIALQHCGPSSAESARCRYSGRPPAAWFSPCARLLSASACSGLASLYPLVRGPLLSAGIASYCSSGLPSAAMMPAERWLASIQYQQCAHTEPWFFNHCAAHRRRRAVHRSAALCREPGQPPAAPMPAPAPRRCGSGRR